MILELDCGNSFIKWRVTEKGDDAIRAGGVVGSDEALLESLRLLPGLELAHSRLVSVRTAEETQKLMEALSAEFALVPVCATSARELAGVVNGYEDYERLGLDRWLALVAAYQLARKAALVIDLGTAVTSDFVDAQGVHLGGYICPGIPLMRNQLRTHTRRIRYDDAIAEQALRSLSPGHSTAEAVERGCTLMLRGFVQAQMQIASEYWGGDFEVYVTGGDAAQVVDVIPGVRVVPDLVFMGLALACPLR